MKGAMSPKGAVWRLETTSEHFTAVFVDAREKGLTAFEAYTLARKNYILPHFSECRLHQVAPFPMPTSIIDRVENYLNQLAS